MYENEEGGSFMKVNAFISKYILGLLKVREHRKIDGYVCVVGGRGGLSVRDREREKLFLTLEKHSERER